MSAGGVDVACGALFALSACHGPSRSTAQVRKLVCNFEAPDDDVFTLYDNWEKAVARFPHVSRIWGSWLSVVQGYGTYV